MDSTCLAGKAGKLTMTQLVNTLFPIKTLYLVSPRGFCAGVDRAVQVVKDCIELFGKPIYVKHEIVHNKRVVQELETLGAITVEHIEDIPEGSTVVFSAHGSPPEHFEQAKQRNLRVIDATCPLVTKVHLEVHRYAREGYKIIYIGHKGHVEGIGVRNELSEEAIPIVDSIKDVELLDIGNPEKLIYLTQTTLSVEETKEIIAALERKYPKLQNPPKEDICYATTNRQAAVKELAKHADVILVVGSTNSSNSNRLVETAKIAGKPAYLLDSVDMIQPEWFEKAENLGITAGASAPENLIQEIVEYFTSLGAELRELNVLKENITFAEPIELERYKKHH